VAGYSAVIDLRVNGLDGLRTVSDRIESINRLIKQIKPVPTLFDKRGSDELKAAKQALDNLVKAYADGGSRSAAFSTSVAGLNQQLTTFRAVAANAKTGSDQFTNALKAAEIATNKLNSAELQRLNTLKELYTRRATGGLSAEDQGPSGLTKNVLALGKQLPASIAGLRAYAAELDRIFNLVEAGSVDYRTLQKEIARVNAAMDIAGGAGPVQGPALPPGMRPGARGRGPTSPIGGGPGYPGSPGAQSAMFENLALGAGFPLLFGGGAGQVAGGLAGSFVGTGFGGQILGSAIGQQLEDATRRITEIGTALDRLNMDALRDSVLLVNSELTNQVRLLQEAGRADEARAAIAKEVALQTGLLPEAVNDITNNTTLLGNTWNEFVGAVSGTLAILGAPFASALTFILQGLAKALQGINIIATGLASILKSAVEWAAKTLGLGGLLENVKNQTTAISEEEQKRLATLQKLTDGQIKEIQNNQTNLQLEAQRTLGRTTAEKQINAEIDSQLAKDKIRLEYAEKAKQIREEYGSVTSEAGKRELELALAANEALKQQALNQQKIKDLLVQQAAQIDANTEKYTRATEVIQQQVASLDRGNQVTQSRYQVETALNDLYGAQLQRQYELATSAEERYKIALKMFEQQVQAAKLEYDSAVTNNEYLVKKAELEARIVEIKYQQLEAEKQIALAQAESRGATDEQVQKISAGYDKALDAQQGLVSISKEQVAATREIADNQNKVADAVYKTKVIQAEGNLAQKLTSQEIGLSKEQADKLAGSLANGAYNANQMASALGGVAQQARNAVVELSRVENVRPHNVTRQSGYEATYQYSDGTTGYANIQAHYAQGGYVTGPTSAMIGEGGESEYVIPASKMSAAMARYASGQRGDSVIPGGNTAGAPGDMGSTSINPMINVTTGPVMNMNGSNYVSQRDFVAGMQAASRRGAEMALSAMRKNGGIRRSVGAR
jgi:hypothetical protein